MKNFVMICVLSLVTVALFGQSQNTTKTQKSETVQLHALHEEITYEVEAGQKGDELIHKTYSYRLNQRLSIMEFISHNNQYSNRYKNYYSDARKLEQQKLYYYDTDSWTLNRIKLYQYNSENKQTVYKDSVYSAIPDTWANGYYWHLIYLVLTDYLPDNLSVHRNEQYHYGEIGDQISLDSKDYVYDDDELSEIETYYIDLQSGVNDTLSGSRELYEYGNSSTTIICQTLENETWKNVSKEYKHYDAESNIDTLLYFVFNDTTSEFEYQSGNYYSYTESGKLTGSYSEYLGTSFTVIEDTLEYDMNDQLTMKQHERYSDDELAEWDKETYAYDVANRLVYFANYEKSELGEEWVEEEKYYYFDDLGNPIMDVLLQYDADAEELVFVQKKERYYTESIDIESMVLPHTLDKIQERFSYRLDSVCRYHFYENDWEKYEITQYNYQLRNFYDMSSVYSENQNALSFFPNPAKEFLEIQGDNIRFPLEMFVYSLNGQLVKTMLLTDSAIPVSDLLPGVYLFVLYYQSNCIAKEKITIGH